MPGSEWNQLVAAPTSTEIEAALAEVRVRAVPIARRRARNLRALRMGGLVLVAGAAFWAGDANGRAAIDTSGDLAIPEVSIVPAAESTSARPGLLRWHIASWVEFDGERMSSGDGWIEGPPGTGFTINKWNEAGLLTLRVQPGLQGDAMFLMLSGTTSRALSGDASSTTKLSRTFSNMLRLPEGKSALIVFQNTSDEGRMVIRIEGPAAAPPAGDIAWMSAGAYSLRNRWGQVPSNVRMAVRNIGALGLMPTYQPLGGGRREK